MSVCVCETKGRHLCQARGVISQFASGHGGVTARRGTSYITYRPGYFHIYVDMRAYEVPCGVCAVWDTSAVVGSMASALSVSAFPDHHHIQLAASSCPNVKASVLRTLYYIMIRCLPTYGLSTWLQCPELCMFVLCCVPFPTKKRPKPPSILRETNTDVY